MRLRSAQHRLTKPLRMLAVPVLAGNGRGLRVRFGESTLSRAFRSAERRVEDAILAHLSSGEIFYDVGANVGWYSLLAARAVGPTGQVVAFEPSLVNAASAQHNAAVNGLANVTVVCAALTDEDGWLTFLDRGNLEGRLDKLDFDGQNQPGSDLDSRLRARAPVPVARLDSWLGSAGVAPPSLVKIDVEGAELGVLRGMEQTLRAVGPTLVIELHRTREQVESFLGGVGYELAPLDPLHILARPTAPARGSG